jgi:hypothetical protein
MYIALELKGTVMYIKSCSRNKIFKKGCTRLDKIMNETVYTNNEQANIDSINKKHKVERLTYLIVIRMLNSPKLIFTLNQKNIEA